jgi:preprotein translocase subunit SecA
MSSALLADHADVAPARPYPERIDEHPAWHDRCAASLVAAMRPLHDALRNPLHRYARIVGLVDAHDGVLRAATDAQLQQRGGHMRSRLRRGGFTPALVGECFALVREAAARTIGKRHYGAQLMAGWVLLDGKLAEMATGEGKTFVASLPACAVALAGYPVHVVTVNDYLASRDAAQLAPLYAFLGLDVGVVIQGMAAPERRAAYACAITYCTNKEVAFDYLKDKIGLTRGSSRLHLALDRLRSARRGDDRLILRGLHFAIVDEADSVFIDEARTPLILSSSTQSNEEADNCARALALAADLVEGVDYLLDRRERSVSLCEPGQEKVSERSAALDGVWSSRRAREELVHQALSAQLLYQVNQHYVVANQKIQIVDESTGRVMPDRSWERGLHQMIETKEGCSITARRETLARITYQRLFRRYLRLSGMTGTASETAREIKALYRLDVVRIPLHKASQRQLLPGQVCRNAADKWQAVADATAQLAQAQRPVLIGTRSVEASEALSAVLAQRGIAHALLNARQDHAEADIIAQAGSPGQVTVATNMAGRGTDIHLDEGVAERGGLHVILTEYHESQRVDRQLFGRCARQGDPGSCQAIVAVDDALFTVHAAAAGRAVAALAADGHWERTLVHQVLRRLAQFSAERRHAGIRMQHFTQDRRLEQVLAFSGRGE